MGFENSTRRIEPYSLIQEGSIPLVAGARRHGWMRVPSSKMKGAFEGRIVGLKWSGIARDREVEIARENEWSSG